MLFTVTVACKRQNGFVIGWRRRIHHPPRDDNPVIQLFDIQWQIAGAGPGKGRDMDPGDMGRVQQVVDHIKIMTIDVHAAAGRAAPCRIVEILNGENIIRIGGRRVPHPDPQDAPAILNRIRADTHPAGQCALLCRGLYAGPATVKGQPVISAFDMVAFQSPFREGQLAVRASIFQRCRHTLLGAENDNRFIQNTQS